MTTHLRVDAWCDEITGENHNGRIACGIAELPAGDKWVYESDFCRVSRQRTGSMRGGKRMADFDAQRWSSGAGRLRTVPWNEMLGGCATEKERTR